MIKLRAARPAAPRRSGRAALLLSGCAALLVSGCAALLLSGCAAGASRVVTTGHAGHRPTTGHVAGRLVMEGGPLGPGGRQPPERPLRGTVTFTAAGHRPVTVRVGRSGTFTAALPPGRYQASGGSPDVTMESGGRSQEMPCSQTLPVTVAAGRTSTVTVACVVP